MNVNPLPISFFLIPSFPSSLPSFLRSGEKKLPSPVWDTTFVFEELPATVEFNFQRNKTVNALYLGL